MQRGRRESCHGGDNRRLEVVADGLPLFGGVQLAIDTTLVSALQGDGGQCQVCGPWT